MSPSESVVVDNSDPKTDRTADDLYAALLQANRALNEARKIARKASRAGHPATKAVGQALLRVLEA